MQTNYTVRFDNGEILSGYFMRTLSDAHRQARRFRNGRGYTVSTLTGELVDRAYPT